MKSPAKLVRKVFSAALSAALVFSMSPVLGGVAHADDAGGTSPGTNLTTEVVKDVKFGQTDARQMLGQINGFRTTEPVQQRDISNQWQNLGVQPQLAYDYKLEEAAMLRAVEISRLFDHVRPNGKYFSSLHTTLGSRGENIAYGQGLGRDRAMELWKEDNQLYNGQGHRRNMLSGAYHYVAVAHATINGMDYWVQEFGSELSAGGSASTNADDSTRDVEIEVPVSRDAVTGISQINWAGGYGNAQIYPGETVQFYANVTPLTALNRAIKWEVKDKDGNPTDKITIDSNGLCMCSESLGAYDNYTIHATSVGNPEATTWTEVHAMTENIARQQGISFCTITYRSQKDNVADLKIKVRTGQVPNYPLQEAPDGSRFMGWYQEPECKNLINHTAAVTQDATYYAKWESPASSEDPEAQAREAARTDLTAAINKADSISNDNGDYTPESFKLLTDAIAAAESVAGDSSSTKEQLDNARTAIENAEKGLVKIDRELEKARSDLRTAIAEAEKVDNPNPGDSEASNSFGLLQQALGQARSALNNSSATRDTLNSAKTALETARQNFDTANTAAETRKAALAKARKDLTDALAGAAKFSNDGNIYTPDSFERFANARTSAQEVLNNTAATSDQLNNALTDLNAAQRGLKVDDTDAAQLQAAKQVLDGAIAEAKLISNANNDYTPESFQKLQDAIAAGRGLLRNESASKASLDAATKNITDARAALKEASKDPDPEPSPDPTPGPEPSRPDRPVTPAMPADPDEPTSPASPAPAKPEEPAKPDEHANPDPTKTEQPDKPAKPAKPAAPKASVVGTKAAIERYTTFKPRAPKISADSIQTSWASVAGAARYVVYMTPCGKGNKYKKVATLTKPSCALKDLKKGTYYRYYVKALDKDGKSLGKSMVSHVLTKGGKAGNPEGVKLTKSASKGELSLKKGGSKRIIAKAKKGADGLRHHGEMLRFASSDTDVATVTSKGKVKGVGKGTATIWVFTANCKVAKVKVAVR